MAKEPIIMKLFRQEDGKPLGRAELNSIMKNFLMKGYHYSIVPGEDDDTYNILLEPEIKNGEDMSPSK